MRSVVRYVALSFFAIVVFVFALQMTFPYSRVKDKLVEALAEKYEVTISGVERGIVPGRVYFKAVTLRTRQTKPEELVTTFFIKQVQLDAGILSLLGGTISMEMEAQIGAGTLSGSVEVAKFGRGDTAIVFTGTNLPADSLPMRGLLGLPMSGKLEFAVDLKLPVEKSKAGKPGINWQKVAGVIAFGCPTGCTFGDGKTRLKPLLKNTRNQAMVGEGIDFGKINLDSLVARATFKKGILLVEKFETQSKDGDLKVDFQVTLEKNFDDSMVAGCLRFKGTPELLKREAKTYAALQTTGAELRGDGMFHIRLTDRFKDMKRLNQECGPNAPGAGSVASDKSDKSDRPGLTMQPDKPGIPTTAVTPAVPTPSPMEPPTPTEGSAAMPAVGVGSAEGRETKETRDARERAENPGRLEDGAGSAGAPTNAPSPNNPNNNEQQRDGNRQPPVEGAAPGSAQQPSIE